MALSLWLCGVIEAYRNCSPRRSLGDKPEVNVCAMTTITCWRAGAAHTDGMNTTTTRMPSFGIDAPLLVAGFALLGPTLFALGTWLGRHPGLSPSIVFSLQSTGASMLGSALLMLASSILGKPYVARHLVHSLRLRGDEHVLDVGCGRGLLLLETARQLPRGHAFGIDLWNTRDQSGNAREATLTNARIAGVADRVTVESCDMRQLPYADARFDAIESSLAIHNLPLAADRERAVCEIARALKPGGRVALLDFRHTGDYARTLRARGLVDVTRSWPNLFMFPPVRIVRGRKPDHEATTPGDSDSPGLSHA